MALGAIDLDVGGFATGGIEAEGSFLMDAALPAMVLGAIVCPRGINVDAWIAIGSFFLAEGTLVLAGGAVEESGASDPCCVGRDSSPCFVILLCFELAEESSLLDMMIC